MSARRLPAILAVVAGAAVLAAAGAWFLRGGEPPAPADGGPAPPEPVPENPEGVPGEGRVPIPAPPPPPKATPFGKLRLLDAGTRLPVPHGRGATAHLVVEDGDRKLKAPLPILRVEEGRWVLGWPFGKGADPRKDFPPAAADAARVEVRAPGYERLSVDAATDLDGAKEHLLRPLPPSVVGEFVGGPGVLPESFTCDLLPRHQVRVAAPGGEPPPPPPPVEGDPPVLPDRLGPFRIHDLPAGSWRLDARASVGSGTARVVRDFEKGEGTVDLGEIRLVAPVTLRARVVGADGSGVLDAGLRLTRGDERADLPEAGLPDKEGWVEFRGLEAGVEYLLLSQRFEDQKRTVHAPAEGGKTVTVELSTGIQGVRCRIRFTVHGQDPVKWGAILDGPTLDDGAWKQDGRIEHEMAAGEYGFSIEAQPVGKDSLRAVSGRFTVPEGKRDWEATVDLREGE